MNKLFFVAMSLFVSANCFATDITTITIRDKANTSTANYPITFGHLFKQGDITGNVYLRDGETNIATQTDIKTTWGDGSIKFAVVSAIVPVTANTDTVLTISTTGLAASTTPMTKAQVLETDVGAVIDLTNISDSGYSGSLSGDLRAALTAQPVQEYWLSGGVATEMLVESPLNNSLLAKWEVRVYSTGHIKISNCLENTNYGYIGNVTYDLSVKIGSSSPSEILQKTAMEHTFFSRWRKTGWVGQEPPEVEIRYTPSYLLSTNVLPSYDNSLEVSETTLSTHYALYLSKNRDIMGTDPNYSGLIMKAMGTTGGRPEIGLMPQWAALYLLTMDNRMREMVVTHGELAGNIPLHYRESDNTKGNYGKFISIDDRPTFNILNASLTTIGTTNTNYWGVNIPHHGDFSTLAYTITGEKFFLDELNYWAAWVLAYNEYRRNGEPRAPDLPALGVGYDSSRGIFYTETRGLAWSLRTVGNAAALGVDGTTAKSYFKQKSVNNVEWLWAANGPLLGSVDVVRVPRDQQNYLSDAPWTWTQAPWQHDFVLLNLAEMSRKDDYTSTSINALVSKLGKFTIGRFTNHPDFNKWDGAGYWWPICKSTDSAFSYTSWADYWADVLAHDQAVYHQGLPHVDYSKYKSSPDTYIYIALATLKRLPQSTERDEAIALIEANDQDNILSTNPTWAMATFSGSLAGSGLTNSTLTSKAGNTAVTWRAGNTPVTIR